MLKKFLKNKQLVALILLLLLTLIFLIAFVIRPRATDKQVKGVEDRQGTTVEYKEGRITKKIFGGLGKDDQYKVNFLPTLTINDNSDKSWEINESILNDKEGVFNANIIFKSGDVNIVLSIINNNKTLESGKTCFVNDDISKVNDTWTREKMIDVSGQQSGFVFMKNSSYLTKEVPEFDSYYDGYIAYQRQLGLEAKDKSIINSCSTAARMNLINYKSNDGEERKGLIRIFFNKGIVEYTADEINKIDTFIKNTNF